MNREKSKEKTDARVSPKDRKKRLGREYNLFWVILFIFIITYFIFTSERTQQVNLPYSQFKEVIGQGKVKEVTFQGDRITGEFKDEYIETSNGEEITYHYFSTTKPPVEDPELLNVLEKNNVTIHSEEERSPWLSYLFIIFFPWILLIGYFIFMRKKIQGQRGPMGSGSGLFGIGKSKAVKYKKEKDDVTFNDVAGLEEVKKDLKEIVEYLRNPERFQNIGAEIPRGVLILGPPGCGKTLFAKAVAGEADIPFFSISGSEFIEMFVGVGASRVRDMFNDAKREAPSIIFIDEIDSIGRARGTGLGGGHDEREQTLNQILNEMDGFTPKESVIVMAATNRPDVLDQALTRPGRFDRQIKLELPRKETRKKILDIHIKNIAASDDIDTENIAASTVGFSGADLKNLINEAALLAGRKNKEKVEKEDFEQARDKIILGMKREERLREDEKKLIAYHEAGHAVVAHYLPTTDPVRKVTIIPRGKSLGATEQVPDIDRYNLSRDYLLDMIAVRLGGRAAESIVFNTVTNGAANDFKQVTKIARQMVCQWGMSEELGPVNYRFGEEHLFLGREMAQSKDFSEHTAKIIDEQIQKILKDMQNKAEEMLKKNRTKLDRLATELMEKETLQELEINEILNN